MEVAEVHVVTRIGVGTPNINNAVEKSDLFALIIIKIHTIEDDDVIVSGNVSMSPSLSELSSTIVLMLGKKLRMVVGDQLNFPGFSQSVGIAS